MSPYQMQTSALRKAYKTLVAAADQAQDADDQEDYEMFSKAAEDLNEAFRII